ncbi:tetratricopeptide repeat-containing sensor histidine kinase [Aureispira anguillae]|uniref:Histidine kinase n=1 Tax=Aureispira anguillae TaxID=2864201 RepID=A0A916DVJ0_9BACT|nr:histidine kinase [Aureispira anguillae]BDS13181.1 histidine kinase [Aureispira anguillae]
MKLYFSIALFLFFSTVCFAQEYYTELEGRLTGNPSDTVVKTTYNELISLAWSKGDWAKAKAYAHKFQNFCEKTEGTNELILSWTYLGYTYQKMNLMDSAAVFFENGVAVVDSLKFEGFSVARLYDYVAFFYKRKNVTDSMNLFKDRILNLPCQYFTDATAKMNAYSFINYKKEHKETYKILHDALACSKTLERFKESCSVLNLLARYSVFLHDYELGIDYTEQALMINQQLKDTVSILDSYNTLGNMYLELGENEIALEWYKKAIFISESAISHQYNIKINWSLATSYSNLAMAYKKVEKYDSAYIYIQKAINFRTYNDMNRARAIYSMADIMMEIGEDPQTALDSILVAEKIIVKIGSTDTKYLRYYSSIQILKGRAYRKLGQLTHAERSLLNGEKVIKEIEYKVDLYRELAQLYVDKENYKKAYQYQLLVEEWDNKLKSKERQDVILRFDVKYESEKLKRKNLELEKNNELQQQELVFNTQLNTRNRYIILGLILLILLLIGIGTLIYRQKNLQTQFKIMKLEQKALKAQINPHFFFNVLNSLQGTILSEEPMVAYKYHTKFTKLMRLILMQSDQEGIALSEEIEALRLYLELEQLRTGAAFDFEIINDLEEGSKVIVPSMLLQPFVENAIWHGVMNREEGEEKKIIIRIKGKGERIVCEIEDTGVGRKQAELIKQQKTNKHKSMGMKVTQNRLELFQLRYKMPLNFGIQDVLDPQGKIFGTKVKVEIPTI